MPSLEFASGNVRSTPSWARASDSASSRSPRTTVTPWPAGERLLTPGPATAGPPERARTSAPSATLADVTDRRPRAIETGRVEVFRDGMVAVALTLRVRLLAVGGGSP